MLAKMASRAHQYNAQKNFAAPSSCPRPLNWVTRCRAAHPSRSDVNVQTETDAVENGMLFVDEACSDCVQANQSQGTNLRTVIIGHTHHARIAVRKMPDGTPFTLIDCGAWIEKCIDAAAQMPSRMPRSPRYPETRPESTSSTCRLWSLKISFAE